jgi:hypothetical protein
MDAIKGLMRENIDKISDVVSVEPESKAQRGDGTRRSAFVKHVRL